MRHIYLLILIAIPLFYSCETHKKPLFKIGFSQCVGGDEWRQQMLREMQNELEFHPEIEFIYKDANNSSATQIKQIQELIDAKVDVLLVSPNESDPLTEIVESAYKQKIPVILIDRKINSTLYTCFVGADNFEVGNNAAFAAVRMLEGEGKILEIAGLPGSSPAVGRSKGFLEGIKNEPNIKIKQKIHGNWYESNTIEALKNIITKNDSFDLVYAHNDVMAMAAYQYFNRLQPNNNMLFLGIDGLSGHGNGIDLVQKEILKATVLYPTGGSESIKAAIKLLEGDSIPKKIQLASTIINKRNARILEQQAVKLDEQRNQITQLNIDINQGVKNIQLQRYLLIFAIVTILVGIILFYRIYSSFQTIKKQNKIIEEQNQRLDSLNKTKNKFFSIVAHDLRSPLTSLKFFSSVMIENYDDIDRDEMINMMKNLDESVENAIIMTDNLITWARIQMNEIESEKQQLKIPEILNTTCEVYETVANKKGVELHCHIDESLELYGDKNQLEFVFRNLINNAIKFTNKGGSITLSATKINPKQIEIKVSDTGVGIHEKVKESILKTGINQSTRGTDGEKGTGLGLMLCFDFIHLNNGSYNLETEVGKGTTFTVVLPTMA